MNTHELYIVISLSIFAILYYNRIGISGNGTNRFLRHIDSKWSSDGEYIYPS